jgi:hypothetical protein
MGPMSDHEAALWARKMAPDLRPVILAALRARYGSLRAFAPVIAPRWGVTPASALTRLSRYFSEDPEQHRDLTSAPLAVMLDALDLELRPGQRAGTRS